jgi:hypothetical protein
VVDTHLLRDTLKRHQISHHGDETSPTQQQNEVEMSMEEEAESVRNSVPAVNLEHLELQQALAEDTSATSAANTALPFDLTATPFDPLWDGNFELGPDFSIGDLGTFDINNAGPNNPWLPLRPQPEIPAMFTDVQVATPSSSTNIPDRWHTRLTGKRRPSRDDALLEPSAEQLREELSRSELTTSLQHRLPDPWLPPTSFLNRALHAYTTRLWHLIPVVHLPSFVPSRAHPLLLLSICSLGALAEGSPDSLRHAFNLFEGIQKAILVAWDPNNVFEPASLALIQAATIGQTFAILSPKVAHLATARAFHGTLCVSAENFQEVFRAGPMSRDKAAADGEASLVARWQEWISLQTCIRVANALQCHDGEIAATFQRRPVLRMPPSKTMFAASDAIFQLKSATRWHEALLMAPPEPNPESDGFSPRCSVYSACAFLESMLAEIIEVRLAQTNFMQAQLDRLELTLIETLARSAEVLDSEASDRLYIKLMFHACFIQLLCNFDQIERRLGKDGQRNDNDSAFGEIREWTATDRAKRCLVHAASISNASAQFRLSDTPALHVARTMYSAAIVCIAYATSAPSNFNIFPSNLANTFPEFGLLGTSGMPFPTENVHTRNHSTIDHCASIAFSLTSALRCLGPWQNAHRYCSTLEAILAEHER